MPSYRWGIAQLNGAAMARDPRISLMMLIKNNWEPFPSVPLAQITVDTKLTANAKPNSIIIEKMPVVFPPQGKTVGNSRKLVRDHYRIFVSARGWSHINNAYLMVEHLDDILDANKTALQVDGIDWFDVTDVELLTDNTNTQIQSGQAVGEKRTTYVVRVTLTFEKVLVQNP